MSLRFALACRHGHQTLQRRRQPEKRPPVTYPLLLPPPLLSSSFTENCFATQHFPLYLAQERRERERGIQRVTGLVERVNIGRWTGEDSNSSNSSNGSERGRSERPEERTIALVGVETDSLFRSLGLSVPSFSLAQSLTHLLFSRIQGLSLFHCNKTAVGW